jgi:hypothetical protein
LAKIEILLFFKGIENIPFSRVTKGLLLLNLQMAAGILKAEPDLFVRFSFYIFRIK